MIRFVYAVISRVSLPVFFIYLVYRGIKEPSYRARKRERFGCVPSSFAAGSLWFHTVSAGEAIAAIPIIDSVLREQEKEHVLVTTTTPTGYEAINSRLGSRVDLCYVPYDIPSCVNRFLKKIQPKALFLMETELWPNLVNRTTSRGVPVYLLNARLSKKSATGYARLADLKQSMLNNIRAIACQYQDTAERFQRLGYPEDRLTVTGSVKFDLTDPSTNNQPDKIKTIKNLQDAGKLVWIAGSTHAPEEKAVLTAHMSILKEVPNAKLILVPRHTTRADEIVLLCRDLKMQAVQLSDFADHETDVIVIDQMGILFTLYQCALVAFVGGSLQHTGGHNPIEPAFYGLPVLMGPNRRNFEEVCSKFADKDCLFTVTNAAEIAEKVLYFYDKPDSLTRCSERARAVVRANQGARTRVRALVIRWLDEINSVKN